MYAGKVYTVNVGGSALTPSESAKLMSLPDSTVNATAVRTELTTELGRIDVAISSRNAVAPDNTSIAAIKVKTDALPASPAAVSDIPTAAQNASQVRTELTTELGRIDQTISSRLGGASYVAPDNAKIADIKSKTDNLPDDPTSTADLSVVNEGIKKASLLIPHTTNI
jgi:hypothetical protein